MGIAMLLANGRERILNSFTFTWPFLSSVFVVVVVVYHQGVKKTPAPLLTFMVFDLYF